MISIFFVGQTKPTRLSDRMPGRGSDNLAQTDVYPGTCFSELALCAQTNKNIIKSTYNI